MLKLVLTAKYEYYFTIIHIYQSRQTKLSNAYFKQPVKQLDCLLPWQQNPTRTKFSDIFENIVLLFLPIFKPFTLDGICTVGLMSYLEALQ